MLICCPSVASLVHKRLYPELEDVAVEVVEAAKNDGVQPFTDEQLRSLYYNYELEHVDEFVETFLQVHFYHCCFIFYSYHKLA